MNEELKKELEAIEKNLEGKSLDQVKAEIKTAIEEKGFAYHEATEEKFALLEKANETLTADLEKAKEDLTKVDAALAKKVQEQIESKGFEGAWQEMITKNRDMILDARGKKEINLELKADMTVANTVTGSAVRTVSPGESLLPYQTVNFRELVPVMQSATGIYVFYREAAPTGAPARQTEGSAKANIEFKTVEVTVNAAYLAGFVRFSRQLATDLPFLQSGLPSKLVREYYKAENADFYATLAAAATASTEVITGKNKVEMLINDIAKLEEAEYIVNGIAIRPSDWWDILKTEKSTGAGYGLPGLVQAENGQIRLNGIPLIRATWVAADAYIVGDWTYAQRLTVAGEGLNVRFFEQDANNVTENKVTARVEERNALVVEQPAAFTLGDFTAV